MFCHPLISPYSFPPLAWRPLGVNNCPLFFYIKFQSFETKKIHQENGLVVFHFMIMSFIVCSQKEINSNELLCGIINKALWKYFYELRVTWGEGEVYRTVIYGNPPCWKISYIHKVQFKALLEIIHLRTYCNRCLMHHLTAK